MKKPLRLIAALLAFCVAFATFPPAGLALEEDSLRSGGSTLQEMIAQASPGDTITLPGDTLVSATNEPSPWIIDKDITIEGQNHSINVNMTGILLGADVTFRNVKIDLISTDCRNAIIANGYALTLDNVTATNLSANVFCGTLLKGEHETYFSVPAPGTAHTVNILGNTNLQSPKNTSLGSANIFAGSLAMGGLSPDHNGPEDDGPANTFPGDVTINIARSAGSSALGTVYAGGGQQRIPVGAQSTKITVPDPDKYKVGGTVTITGAAIPTVDGAGSGATEVVYQGGGNQAGKTFSNLSSLSVESGDLVLQSGSSFQAQPSLSVSSGAFLNIKDLGNLSISDFYGGGSLVLGQNQTLTIEDAVTGTTKVGIGTIFNNASQTIPLENHPYIKAPQSQAGDFELIPYSSKPDMTLEWQSGGEWTVPATVVEVSKLVSLAPEDVQVTSGEAEVIILLNSVYTGDPLNLEELPLTLRVNGSAATFDSADGYYEAAGLRLYVDNYGSGDVFAVYRAGSFSDPIPDGTYDIEIVVPGANTASGTDLSASCTLTVGDAAPALIRIPVPKANAGLKWTGAAQTGVNAGEGYTLSGDYQATAVGSYTATATLESGYQWTSGSMAPQTISWSIAKARGPAAPAGLAGVAPTTVDGTDGKITGTTSAMEYATGAGFTNPRECGDSETTGLSAGTYYVRVKETATHEAGASTSITVPVPGAEIVIRISVHSTAHKTEYSVGEDLDVADLVIEATYSGGTTRQIPVTADMVSGFDSTAPAESQTLTIVYEGKSTSYTVRITAWTPPTDHTHSWSTAWQSSGTHHWHNCDASGCPITQDSQKSGYAAHTAGNWVVDRPATSSQTGTRHRSCTICGYEIARETIPATGGGSSSGGSSSSGGGSSSGGSSNSTTTVKNPDGSTTSTSTNKTTGTVTETTKRPDGSKTVVETRKDGTVTTTDTAKDGSTVQTVARPGGSTETTVKLANGLTASIQENKNSAIADVRIPSKVVEESPKGNVALPIPTLPGENASVTIYTSSAQPVAVEIPVYGNDGTTIACLVNRDGSETILKTVVLSGGQITVSVSDGATVHIRDNGKNFQDIRGHWAKSAIDFVTARELFSGKTATTFVPDASMSRAMLMTVLARLDGVDTAGGTAYEKGMAWAVTQGISDGRNPDSQVTREQFVAMLYRYAGSPAAMSQALPFSDVEKISAYAREAVCWAMETGILSGYENGSFIPDGKTTRGQAAAMLTRYVKYLNQQ